MNESDGRDQHRVGLDEGQPRSSESADTRNVAAGLIDGNFLQAGVVHGDVHFHGRQEDQVVIPRQLIPPDEYFIGRRQELDVLDRAIQRRTGSSPMVVLLKGPGGVGKTALALKWLGQLTSQFPNGQMYADLVDIEGKAVAPEDLLGQFLRALGIDPRHVPSRFAERAALFRSLTVNRSLALLLDNAVSAAQVRGLLPASGNSLVVVTSRHSLLGLLARGAHVVQVDPLDADSALELLEQRVGMDRVRAERGHAAVLAKLCGGLPIALCVAAALTVSRPRRSLAWTAEELREEHRRLEVLSVDEDMSVRATFDVSYAALPEFAARAYRALGLCPGVRWSIHLVAASIGTDLGDAQRAADQLVDASLLEDLGEGYYRFHDLIRVHARERVENDETTETRNAIIRRMIEWYLLAAQVAGRAVMPARRSLAYNFDQTESALVAPTGIDRYAAALRWFAQERSSLVTSVRTASRQGWYGLTCHLADAMQPLFIVQKHLRDAVDVDELAVHAARATGDLAAENNMSKRLARACARLGEFDKAQRQVDVMLEQNRRVGDRRGEASTLKSQGIVFVETGQLDRAVEVFRDALAIVTELDRPRAQGLVLINLGETLLTLGQYPEAAELLERARITLSTLDTPDSYNAARAMIILGRIHVQTGQYDDARAMLDEALSMVTKLRSAFEQARAHRALADLALRTGNAQAAERHQQAAVELASSPGLAELDVDG